MPLLRPLGLAHHWQRLLGEERVSSVDEELNVSYVRRVLRFTLMAPQVFGRLAAGASANLEDLSGQPLSTDWTEHAMLLYGQEGESFKREC